MTVCERLAWWSSLALAAFTGGVYGLLRWFGLRAGEFGPEPHPWQGIFQHLHVLGVPLLVFALGWHVRGHALKHLPGRRHRGTGLGLLALAAPMILSGYGIQVSTSPGVQTALRWLHAASAGIFLATIAVHALRRKRS